MSPGASAAAVPGPARGRLRGVIALLILALGAWSFFPVVLLVHHAAETHAQFTGADGLIGADGVLGADQLQYLAWARDVADHGLASNLFALSGSGHVYLEPVFGIIGGLRRLGASLVLAYLAFKAVAVIALVAGVTAWARRLLGARPGAVLAAVTLALFIVTPATALVNWLQPGSARFRFAVYLAGDELAPATKLWGYLPAALALALMPVAVLALERALQRGAGLTRGPLVVAAGAGLLTSWLHPWQGITLAIILVALALARRARSEWPVLAAVLVAVLAPLAYYAVLAHADPAWRMASHHEDVARLPATVLIACLGPLVVIGALGVRRPGGEVAEQALLLWVPAALITYVVNDAFATHALQGISIPFAVLAVRGAARLRLPAVAGIACVGLLTVPGLSYDARKFVRTSHSSLVQYALPDPDAAALDWVARHAPPGGVLAPTPFAAVIPSQTGRAVWVGHGEWSPDYAQRASAVNRLFAGRLAPREIAAFVRGTGARILVADCGHPADLASELGRRLLSVHRFGCARVYVLRPA